MKRPANSPAVMYYKELKTHIESDVVDIYTILAVLLKDYTLVKGVYYQAFKAVVCFLAQTVVPTFVIYDSILNMRRETSGPCPNTGTWQDRTTGCIMAMFLFIFFVHRWAPFTYRLFQTVIPEKETEDSSEGEDGEPGDSSESENGEPEHQIPGIIGILFTKELNIYMSEAAFAFGVLAKMLVHCLTTLSCIFVLFQTVGCIDIVVNAIAMYFLSDVSVLVLDDHLKERTLWYLKRRHKLVVQDSMLFNNADLDTRMSWIDHRLGMIGLFLTVVLIGLLSPLMFLATAGAIIFIPVCHV